MVNIHTIPKFGIIAERAYRNTPEVWWAPIKSHKDIHQGMIFRLKKEIQESGTSHDISYGVVMSDDPTHYFDEWECQELSGATGPCFMPNGYIIQKYDKYVGPREKNGLPPPPSKRAKSPAKPKKPVPPPKTPPPKGARGKVQSTLTPPEEDPAIREKREKQLLSEISKRQAEKKKEQQAALEKLDQEKVAEERKLLQSACLALAYAFGSDAPDACDTEYADIIQHMAADVVLGKIAHKDAVAAITERICADSEKRRALDIIQKGGKSPADPEIDKRLARVEGDIKNLGDQISTMTTHMESVLKRWEAISPFIPRNVVRYYDATEARSKGERGGVIGISSFETGKVEKVPTKKDIDEISDTAILYVKNGLCIHFNQAEAGAIHSEIAEAMGVEPTSLWGYNYDTGVAMFDESTEPGFTFARCFDLRRSDVGAPFRAAGGRIKHPSRMVSRIKKAVGKKVRIVIPPGVDLA